MDPSLRPDPPRLAQPKDLPVTALPHLKADWTKCSVGMMGKLDHDASHPKAPQAMGAAMNQCRSMGRAANATARVRLQRGFLSVSLS